MAELQVHADLPNVELARRLGLSPAATLAGCSNFGGRIAGIRAVVDHEKVGLRVEAFVLVTMAEHSEASDAQFARALGGMPNVLRADAVTGADDVLLHIAAADTRELQEVLRALPRIGARRVTTMLRLDGVKPPTPAPSTTVADRIGLPETHTRRASVSGLSRGLLDERIG